MTSKILRFLLIYISLFLLEIVLSFLMLVLIDTFEFGFDSFYVSKAYYGAGVWSFWRLLFHGLPLIIIFFLCFKSISIIKNKPLRFSFFNLGVYALLSLLSEFIWENTPLPAEGSMFVLTCISIFLAPIVLAQIPYFKKQMENW